MACALGIEVFSSRAEKEKSAIVSLVTGGTPSALVRRCREQGIVINQRSGRIRFSPHCYNTTEEIGRALAALNAASRGT
jgi:selenocysteine lyase/cysteine desulfurase